MIIPVSSSELSFTAVGSEPTVLNVSTTSTACCTYMIHDNMQFEVFDSN
jgi:hypothetical protein